MYNYIINTMWSLLWHIFHEKQEIHNKDYRFICLNFKNFMFGMLQLNKVRF